MNVGPEAVERLLDDPAHPHGGGQMEDAVGTVDLAQHGGAIEDGCLDEPEPRMRDDASEVRHGSRREVVDHDDLVATVQQVFDEVAADEAGAARDDGADGEFGHGTAASQGTIRWPTPTSR